MKVFVAVVLFLLNVAVCVMGVLLVVPDVQKVERGTSGYWQNAGEVPAMGAANETAAFLGDFLRGEPYETYERFRSQPFKDNQVKEYFDAFYAYYFEVMQLARSIREEGSKQPIDLTGTAAPPENLFVGFSLLKSTKDYKNMTEYQRVLLEAAVPLRTFSVWYTIRTWDGYNKHAQLSKAQDLGLMAHARNFIEYFAGRGLPFEYLSRIIALELELMYRQSRTTSFWDTNQRWDAEMLKRVYSRIEEYRERFRQEFSSSQVGAVGWILGMETLASGEVPNTGLFATPEQKAALDREKKLLGAIPGLVLRSLE